MGRNNDDFLSAAGFTPEEQTEAVRGANLHVIWRDVHHQEFHDAFDRHMQGRQLYKLTREPEHRALASSAAGHAKIADALYKKVTGESLLGEDDNCTNCGKSLREEDYE